MSKISGVSSRESRARRAVRPAWFLQVIFATVGTLTLTACGPADTIVTGAAGPIDLSGRDLPGRMLVHPEFFVERGEQIASALTIRDVARPDFDGFGPAPTPRLNFGFIQDPIWVRFQIRGGASAERLLEIGFALIDRIDLYLVAPNGRTVSRDRAGVSSAFALRDRPYRYYIFELRPPDNRTHTVYLRLETRNALVVPLALWSEAAFQQIDHRLQFALGLYYGVIAVMILYNLFLFFTIRDRSYIYYVGTLIAVHGMFQLCIDGLVPELLPYEFLRSGRAIAQLTAGSVSIGLVFALLFCRSFLDTPRNAARLDPVLRVLAVVHLFAVPLMFLLDSYVVFQWIVFLGMVAVCWFLIAGFAALRAGYRPARFYLLAWLLLSVGGFLYGLKSMGWIPSTEVSEYALQVGLAIEAWLLSLALGDRFQTLKQGVIEAQDEALALEYQARETEKLKDEIFALESMEPSEGERAGRDAEEAPVNDGSLGVLLEKILASLHRLLRFERGFIVVSDREDRLHWRSVGAMPAGLNTILSGEEFIQKFLKMPADFFAYLNSVFFLERGPRASESETASRVAQEHAETLATMSRIVEALEREKFHLAIPLSFRRQTFGYVILSKKTSGASYDSGEITILESFRLSLALAVRNAILYEQIKRLRGRAEEKARRLSDYFSDMREVVKYRMSEKTLVFASQRMAYLLELAQKYAKQTRQPILITGPTGTGKELIAQAIHEDGSGAQSPFVALNCAAVPAGLWETEVFGFEKGAFTDARSAHAGRVEQAAGGTLFFDEIGELPLAMQAKMLRLLQEREFQRVGGKKNIRADCRFVFATHRDLKELVDAGSFREDLYYRIHVLEIQVPPLADRPDDIPILLNYFLQKYARELEARVTAIEPAAMETLLRYAWPGNIRELENALIYALLHAASDTISLNDLPPAISAGSVAGPLDQDSGSASSDLFYSGTYDEMVRGFSRNLILDAIESAGGDKLQAARRLGIKRATFYYRLKELGIS
ncbi:MAG: sigma 54-interacting transcriptional regulator [bacterium]|nr:sigma 54-interacting transcriptional regulator [bacterium]